MDTFQDDREDLGGAAAEAAGTVLRGDVGVPEEGDALKREVLKAEQVLWHRLIYMLTPQFDLYRNIVRLVDLGRMGVYGLCPKILDYGCGTGIGTMMFCTGHRRPTGIDCDPHAIDFARKLFAHVADFQIDDWCAEPIKIAPRDMIVCVEVLEHIEDPTPLVDNFARNLKEDGVLVASTLNHNSQYRKNEAHLAGFTVKTFRELLGRRFADIRTTDYTLEEEIGDDSTVTPVVAVCRDPQI